MKTKAEINELGIKIVGGINKALRQLAENAAAKNKSLVIGDEFGNAKTVSAKELLEQLSK